MRSAIVTVSALATYLRQIIEADDVVADAWVEGEVSAYTLHRSGHAYFTIKDADSSIDCVMWRASVARQSYKPRVGDQIVVHGAATVYEKTTRLQLRADVVSPAGAGLAQAQLEQLRQRLEAEGLFDPSRKRQLPAFPRVIGVVTSPSGAVWHDIQRVVARRYPLVELVLSPAAVEGPTTAQSVVDALTRLYAIEPDLIIVARGGGSAEALWGFNHESIVRAVFASPVPVVSAIGHEPDTTLIDFVADVSAATPSVAAELVVPDGEAILGFLLDARARAADAVREALIARSNDIVQLNHRLGLRSPYAAIETIRGKADTMTLRARAAVALNLERRLHELDRTTSRLEALDPTSILARGFAWISRSGGAVRSVDQLTTGDEISLTLRDGSVDAAVIRIPSSSGNAS